MNNTTMFQAVDPTTGALLPGQFQAATTEQIETTCQKAAEAFRAYRMLPGKRRAEFLEAIADAVVARETALLTRLGQETAYPPARILGERDRTVSQLRQFAALLREGSWVRASIDTALPDRKPIPKPDLRQYQIPIGPVVVFGASNFPQAFSTAGGDTASALAAGCPVIVKAHKAHPGTAEIYAEAILEAAKKTGMPDGVFSLIHANSHAIGEALVKNPHVKAVGFTGSYKGGRLLFDMANARPEPIPVYAEMSSTNPVFLLPEALQSRGETIAENFAASLTMGVGQNCTCPGMVVALKGPATDAFAQAVTAQLKKVATGTMVHPSIKQGYAGALKERTSHPYVQTLYLSQVKGAHPDSEAPPAWLCTTGKDFLKHPEIGEEIFGPAAVLVVCENEAEMSALAESLTGQLTGTLHGTDGDLSEHRALFSILEQKVGRLIINGFPTGVEVCPSMHHGGPFPSTTFPNFTSVGTTAIYRFTRPACYQNLPESLLPQELKMQNPLAIWRMINGEWQR